MVSTLGSMSPTAITGAETLIVLKAYYDGGNKADSAKYKVLTLAGYAATDSIWDRIEKRWKQILAQHGAKYIHMTEALSLTEEYSHKNGWNESKVQNVIHDLIGVMEDFDGRPILGISCSVILSDYLIARKKFPDLPPVESLCTTDCIMSALIWYSTLPRYGTEDQSYLPPKCVDLYFDRGEPFCGHALDAWNHKKLRHRDSFRAIRHIGEADMRDVPGLQMADMLAWSHNRPYGKGGHDKLCHDIREAIPVLHKELKLPELVDIDTEKLEQLKQLRLPRRKPMR